MIRSTICIICSRCALSFTKRVVWAYSSPRMKGPKTGSFAFSSVMPTDGLAGSSPTVSSQTCIASSEVT